MWWADQYERTGSWDDLIGSFSNSPESRALYSATSTSDIVEQIFKQSLGRGTATEAGRLYWANQLDSEAQTKGDLILSVLQVGSSGTGRDSQVVANKLAAANSFTDYLAANPSAASSFKGPIVAAGARALLSRVYETLSSLAEAESLLATMANLLKGGYIFCGDNFFLCASSSDCTKANGHWWSNMCNSALDPSSCDSPPCYTDMRSTNYKISQNVFSGGGATTRSSSYINQSTLTQPTSVSLAESTNYTNASGFWK